MYSNVRKRLLHTRRKINYEDAICEEFFYKMSTLHKDLSASVLRIEQGGFRTIIEATKLKRQGVQPGVADYLFAMPNEKNHGLWIEFKHGKNKQTESQKTFEAMQKSNNYDYVVCYSADEAINSIINYLKKEEVKC
jgi:hypothetical protein